MEKLRNSIAKREKVTYIQRNHRGLLCKVTYFFNPKISQISLRYSFHAMGYNFFYKASFFIHSMYNKYALFTPTCFDIPSPSSGTVLQII